MKKPLYASIIAVSLVGFSAVAFAQTDTKQSAKTAPTAAEKPAPGREAEDAQLRAAIEKGATMEEIAQLRDPVAKTPEEAIRALKTGNSRFFGGKARRPELSANERRAQILAQTPFAAVLGCADSRAPIELVYDQGLGDLFSVRVAGNVADPSTMGSIEYAVLHLKTRLVVVMGHEGCGAVKAAMLPEADRKGEPENVQYLLDQIVPSVEKIPALRDSKARMREAVIANVRQQVHKARVNPTIKAAMDKKQIAVIGAFYEISSGQVDFLETDDELRLD